MTDPQVVEQIKGLLGQNRKGITLTDIGLSLNMHRNSVSKYMGILEARGEVESSSFGNTRVFYPTKRLPLSSLLQITSDLVCMVDKSKYITNANPGFYDFFGIGEKDIQGKTIDEIRTTLCDNPLLMDIFSVFLGEEEVISETTISKIENGCQMRNFHFRVKAIPTTFEDGASGTTLWMEDVTSEREHTKNLEFLARTSAELADMSEDADIYRYIVDRIRELEPGCFIGVSAIDMEEKTATLMSVTADPEDLRYVEKQLHQDLEGYSFNLNIEPDAEISLSRKVLIEIPKLYHLLFQQFPEPVTDEIEEHLSLGKSYCMGCVCRNGLYGGVALKLKGSELTHKETIEAFLNQAALALQRRYMKEKLRRAEERIRMLEEGDTIDS